jgi:hypothetical protein
MDNRLQKRGGCPAPEGGRPKGDPLGRNVITMDPPSGGRVRWRDHCRDIPCVQFRGAATTSLAHSTWERKAATVAFPRTLSGAGVTATVLWPRLVTIRWSEGLNHGNPDAMSAHDVDAVAWTAFTASETICVPAVDDTDALVRLAAAETDDGRRQPLSSRRPLPLTAPDSPYRPPS